MNTEQLKQINTHLALIEAELGRIRVAIREASAPMPDGIIGNSSDSPYVKSDGNSPKQPDYTHLLPEGYEFCAESEAEDWVKVENPTEANPLGHIWQLDKRPFYAIIGEYRPIRKIQTDVKQLEHECKYCGVVTSQPDEQCYKNPYAVDWSNAPDWADVHCWDEDGDGYWFGAVGEFRGWVPTAERSNFTLPAGLDWKLSKTFRPR